MLDEEILVLEMVRAIREGNFSLCVESVAALVPWMFVLEQINYAMWLLVHLWDMVTLQTSHPNVYHNFTNGTFVVHKSSHAFSVIVLGHAHEQENASIKGEGGAVGLTETSSALRRWMIGGPEIARMVGEYEEQLNAKKQPSAKHHEQVRSVQKHFLENAKDLVNTKEEMGNPFQEDSGDLLALDTKEIMPKEVVESVNKIQNLVQNQYKAFVNDRMIERKKQLQIQSRERNLYHRTIKR